MKTAGSTQHEVKRRLMSRQLKAADYTTTSGRREPWLIRLISQQPLPLLSAWFPWESASESRIRAVSDACTPAFVASLQELQDRASQGDGDIHGGPIGMIQLRWHFCQLGGFGGVRLKDIHCSLQSAFLI